MSIVSICVESGRVIPRDTPGDRGGTSRRRLPRTVRFAAIPLLLASASGCASALSAAEAVRRGQPLTPPAHYEVLWREVHEELELPVRDFSAVRWYVVARGTCLMGDGTPQNPCTRGITLSDWTVGAPVIALAEDAVDDNGTVTHEMGHVVLGMVVGHRHEFFSRHCSDLVRRNGRCPGQQVAQ